MYELQSVWYEFFPKNTTGKWKYHISAVLGTVMKCQKGTGSAWEKNTMKSCVFYKQYICSAYPRFIIGSKTIWDAWMYVLKTLSCTFFDDFAISLWSNSSCTNFELHRFLWSQKTCISKPYCIAKWTCLPKKLIPENCALQVRSY